MPVLPEIALEVQKRVQNPEAGVDEIVELIKSDVAISSKILRVANSSHYGGNDNIQDLNLAVGRIGLREIQSIVQILCGQQLFNVSHPKIKQLMQKLWEHSLSCAYAAQLLAQTIAMKDSELYFLLGLTHDLGKVFLVQLIAKALEQDPAREQVFSDHIISALLKLMHNQVGALIITKWNYPAIFIEIAHHHNDSVEQACASLPLAATYYSNLLTRKLGYSLDSFDSQQDNLEKAASYLKLTPDQSQEFETVLGDTIHKIKGSFFGLAA
jgi:HD-like signal output (HDOD) protein